VLEIRKPVDFQIPTAAARPAERSTAERLAEQIERSSIDLRDVENAAEMRKPLGSLSRFRQTIMKLASPNANPDKKLPSGTGMVPMDDLSC